MSTPPTGEPVGRPTLYTPDMPDRLRGYIKNYESHGDDIPSRPGFACVVGVCEKTIENWGNKNPEFLRALRELHTAQHRALLNKGLMQQYNSTICKLVLSSNHGYKERSDSTTDDKPITPQSVDFTNLLDILKKGKEENNDVAE